MGFLNKENPINSLRGKKKHVFIYEKTLGDLKLDYEKVD